MKKLSNKKGQITLGDAPSIVLVIGLVFLVMATLALIGEKYGDSLLTDTSGTVTNETGGYGNTTGYTLAKSTLLNAKTFTLTSVWGDGNQTNGTQSGIQKKPSGYSTLITLTNVTTSVAGVVTNNTAQMYPNVTYSYTYIYNPETVAYNATGDLQTEISNNTSIAGIILTISLISIVLSILIGVFLGIKMRSRI